MQGCHINLLLTFLIPFRKYWDRALQSGSIWRGLRYHSFQKPWRHQFSCYFLYFIFNLIMQFVFRYLFFPFPADFIFPSRCSFTVYRHITWFIHQRSIVTLATSATSEMASSNIYCSERSKNLTSYFRIFCLHLEKKCLLGKISLKSGKIAWTGYR